jgi:uncharacterized membrane protein (UPF0127 family)
VSSSRPVARLALLPTALLTAALLSVAACSDAAAPPVAAPSAAPSPSPSVGQRIEQTVQAELGGVELVLEVADQPEQRAVGLMGRTEVPDGTGMVFLFDELVSSSFYMFQVPVPLVAVFVREGVVVGVEQMPPCTEDEPSACPLYGPGAEYDTVVETAPETLPDVAVGDRLEPARPGA